MRSLRAVYLVALLSSPQGMIAQRADLQQKLQQCQVPGVADSVWCGHYEVAEVPTRADARRLALNVVVLPATSDSVVRDPLVFLAGGGVVPATRYAAFLSREFSELRQHRDILLLDQRGTWNSGPLTCAPPDGGPPLPDHECLAVLRQRADLTAYSTAAAMDDLEAVRAWLGYPMLNLYGVSYGTKAAQVYLKQYPARVRTVVLYGVVPIGAASQLDLAAGAQQSLLLVLERCAQDPGCHTAYPQVAAEFDSVIAQLTRAPVTVSVRGPNGSPVSLPVTDRLFRNVVQGLLGSARSIERLPLLIHNAYLGDYAPIARAIVGEGPPPPPPPPRGVFLSILCGESIPLIAPERVTTATAGTFFGEAPVRSQMEACREWPRATLPPAFWEPARDTVPVLVISGDLDPITPPSYGELVVGTLSRGRHLVLPNRSHGDVDPCITALFQRFILSGGARELNTACATASVPLRFAR